MNRQVDQAQEAVSADADAVRKLYNDLLDAWERRNAASLAMLFTPNGNLVGFDGSVLNGRAEIESHLTGIFRDHQTAAYIGKVREVCFLSPSIALLRSVAGMIPPGETDLNPSVNAIQSLVAAKWDGQWRIALYQNTPAAFHGRPDLSQALTAELRELLAQG
ncbi:MAG: SgcJ/EcaC family oxidoreductase [Chloroflexota bacterium]|nr:SgcJ/EcaC family oxidoreductase [Chloroflexota bacterium]